MIPPLDERGLLPPGTHTCDGLGDVERHFATNARRAHLLSGLKAFLHDELSAAAFDLDLYLAGSYFSDKSHPGDIDCTIVLPFEQLASFGLLIGLAADGAKGRIHQQYEVEFYVTFESLGGNDFRQFFSYVGEKTAQAKGIDAKDLRGIVKVNSWTTL